MEKERIIITNKCFTGIIDGSINVVVTRLKQNKIIESDTITLIDEKTNNEILKKATKIKKYNSFCELYDEVNHFSIGATLLTKNEYLEEMNKKYPIELGDIYAIYLNELDANLREKRIDSKMIYDGKILKVNKDNILLPNGNKSTREWILHLGACAIVYVDENDNIILVKQFRYPFNKAILEIPAGKLDNGLEDIYSCAKREFKEETGYVSLDMSYLGKFAVSVAYSTEMIYIFYTSNVQSAHQDFDDDEIIELEKIPFDKALELCNNGEIIDSKTIIAINLYNNLIRKKCKEKKDERSNAI